MIEGSSNDEGTSVWFFRALAFDLDGTLATSGRVRPDVVEAIDQTRRDRAVLLVTGRIGNALDMEFPGFGTHFDAVVTENGSVMRTAGGTRLLHPPIDTTVEKALADRGVCSVRGEVLLDIDAGDAAVVGEVVSDLGLDYQVVRNRGKAMLLPAGITKGTGLSAALAELGLSVHNTAAVGDAENDLAFLHTAEVGVAVADALPGLIQHADLVLREPDGAGVLELLNGPLLRGQSSLCPRRHWVDIGTTEAGEPALVPGSQASVLISGESATGKSYLAGLLAERWIDAGYSVLVVDPEGDHTDLASRPGVQIIDAAVHLPPPTDLLSTIGHTLGSVVLDLSRMADGEAINYLRRLTPAIEAERVRHGVPHWVVYDEAQQHVWDSDYVVVSRMFAASGTCLVTWQPEQLPRELTRMIGVTITTASCPEAAPFSATLALRGEAEKRFAVAERVSHHVRHRHKYATVPLPPQRQFYFRAPDRGEVVAAATLDDFAAQLRHCDIRTLDFHIERADFSRWIGSTLSDPVLAAGLARIERHVQAARAAGLEEAREAILQAIERRYLSP